MMERLLEVRKIQKKRKPKFIRQDAHKKVRLGGEKWRKPKGSDSKMRVGLKGYRKSVSVGYKSPAAVKGFSRKGLEIVHVARKEDLANVDAKKQGIIISAQTGMKKRIEILTEVIKAKISVINIKDAQKYLDTLNDKFAKNKESKVKAKQEKEKKQKVAEKKPSKKEEKASAETATSDEEKKQAAKKEKDKLLTKGMGN